MTYMNEQLFMNISTESAVQAKGLEYISSLISQSQIREELYIKCYESRRDAQHEYQQSHRQYKAALERLYRQILKFQTKSCCYYSNSSAFRYGLDAVKWNDWDQLVNDVRQRDTEFAAFEQIWRDLRHLEERPAAERLQRETMNSIAAIKTEISISREAAESAMTKQGRYELFNWLCDIDPSSIYNTARERHEPGTNEWLIKSEEFQNWEMSDASLLWLHGKGKCTTFGFSTANYMWLLSIFSDFNQILFSRLREICHNFLSYQLSERQIRIAALHCSRLLLF